MADWFKLHENWFHEPRLQWAIKEQASVTQCWLWVLTECCRTKSDTVGLHDADYEMLGIQQLLNISPGIFNQSLNLLNQIGYIFIDKPKKTIKVLKWNEFQSDYLRKKNWRESDKVRQDPTKSDSVVLEERRIDKIRKEEEVAIAPPAPFEEEEVAKGKIIVSQKKRAYFTKPSCGEVEEYAKSISFVIKGQYFLDYQDARAWKLPGGIPMKDWKATLRTWKNKGEEKAIKPKIDYLELNRLNAERRLKEEEDVKNKVIQS